MKNLQQAQELHLRGQLKEAETLYHELLGENPDQADVLHALAVLYAQSERYDEALTHLDKAISTEPNEAALYNSKGNVFLRLNKYFDAAAQYQKAIELDSDYAVAYNNLGKSYYEQEKLDQARAYYEKAIELNQNYSDAYYNLGILLAKLGEDKAAIDALNKTITLAPERASAYGMLAEVYMHEENYPKAIENYNLRIELQPEHTETYFSLGQAYLQNDQFDEAILAFEQTLTLQPKHPEANHNLANAFLASGDSSKAINYYYRQLEVDPITESYYNIGVLFMHQNRHKESAQYLEQAAKLDPDYLPVHINLGALYLKVNRYPDAIKHYEEALKIKPGDPELQHILTAISKGEAPEKAPAEYLKHLFDQYATYYDKHLTEHLKYQAHELLYKAIYEETDVEDPEWTILDLGCGTGLCGELFKKFAKKLIGIDISSEMIAVAKEKNVYDELKVQEVEAALDEFKHNDFIVAGDVFSYIGKLDDIFKKAKSALNPDGLFAFTVEKTYTEPYELQQTIRYAHSKTYLNKLIEESGFETIRFDTIVLRKQKNVPVEGYLVLLRTNT